MTLSSRCFFRLITLSETRLSKLKILQCLEKASSTFFRAAPPVKRSHRQERGRCASAAQTASSSRHSDATSGAVLQALRRKNRLDLGYAKINPRVARLRHVRAALAARHARVSLSRSALTTTK